MSIGKFGQRDGVVLASQTKGCGIDEDGVGTESAAERESFELLDDIAIGHEGGAEGGYILPAIDFTIVGGAIGTPKLGVGIEVEFCGITHAIAEVPRLATLGIHCRCSQQHCNCEE